jgi:hypothetical protein
VNRGHVFSLAGRPLQSILRDLIFAHSSGVGAPAAVAGPLRETVSDAFMSGLHAGCLTASAVCLVGALFVLAFLPAHPKKADSL